MSNDLQVIKELQDIGIELVEVDELNTFRDKTGYVLKDGKVTHLR